MRILQCGYKKSNHFSQAIHIFSNFYLTTDNNTTTTKESPWQKLYEENVDGGARFVVEV